MDPEAFLDLANQVAKIKMYPYFDLAHAIVCCLLIKEDMGPGKILSPLSKELKKKPFNYRSNSVFKKASAFFVVLFDDVNLCWKHHSEFFIGRTLFNSF